MYEGMSWSTAVRYPAQFDKGINEPATSVDRELKGLMERLHLIRRNLSSQSMIKAARITGTVEELRSTVQQLDQAIHVARDVNLLLEARASRSRSNHAQTGTED